MELPSSLLGTVAGEGDIYFFTADCPVNSRPHAYLHQTCRQGDSSFNVLLANRYSHANSEAARI